MKKILFVCEYNACRSQMAEGLARHLFPYYNIHSAGLYPGALHEMTIGVMREIGIDITSQRSKQLEEILSMSFDHVVILAQPAIEPTLKINTAQRLEWLMPDPALASEEREEIMNAMREARDLIKKKLEELYYETSL